MASNEGEGSDDDEAAWSIATAETLRARGDLADAAQWYRRAANALLDAGQEERALEYAKLAAELALQPVATLAVSEEPSIGRRKSSADATGSQRSRVSRTSSTGKNRMPRGVPTGAAQPPATPPAAPATPPTAPATVAPPATPKATVPPPPNATVAPPPSIPKATVAPPAPKATVAPPPLLQSARPPSLPSARPIAPRAPAAPMASLRAPTMPPLPSARPPAPMSAPRVVATSPPSSPPPSPSRLSFTAQREAEVGALVSRLAALPLLAELPTERVREVAKQVQLARFREGETLCETGTAAGPMFVLLGGDARVELPGDEPGSALSVTVGGFVGARTALYGGLRDATVRASGALDTAVFAPTLVRALAREFPAFRASVEAAARARANDLLPFIVPALRRLEPAARASVLSRFETVALPEGALLFIEGEPVRWLDLVAAGEAEVYGAAFGTRRSRHARAGEFVGVVALTAGEASGVTARAAGPMLVARLAAAQFRTVAAQHPAFVDALGSATELGAGVVC